MYQPPLPALSCSAINDLQPLAASLRGLRVSTRKNVWLHQNGRRIQAEFTRELNTSLEVNGSDPYRIVCQWLDPAKNEMHTFNSANIWFDPTNYIPGKAIEVLVDPNNPRRYAVETAFLPKVV